MITSLVALQIVDTKLSSIEMLRGDLPKIVDQLKTELDELREEISSDQLSIAGFQKEKSDLSNEQALTMEKLKKFQDQLYKATSNKEYEATSTQIDFCEQEMNRFKMRIIDIDAKVMELEEGVKPKQERLTGLEKDFSERESELLIKIEETAKEEQELKGQRQNIVPNIRQDLMNKYERIRKAKGGLAVAALNKDTCGGCYNQIPAQTIIEIRKRDKIMTCHFCGRILFVDPALKEDALASR